MVFADPQLFRLHVSHDGWTSRNPRKPNLGNIHNNLPGVMSLEEWMAGGVPPRVRRFTLLETRYLMLSRQTPLVMCGAKTQEGADVPLDQQHQISQWL